MTGLMAGDARAIYLRKYVTATAWVETGRREIFFLLDLFVLILHFTSDTFGNNLGREKTLGQIRLW